MEDNTEDADDVDVDDVLTESDVAGTSKEAVIINLKSVIGHKQRRQGE